MFDNEDDQKFFLKELAHVQEKGEKRKAAFKSMVDHFFKSDAEKERDARRLASESQQAGLLSQQNNQQNPQAPTLQRSGFGLHGEKNKTSLANNQQNQSAPNEISISGGPEKHEAFSSTKQSVTGKFGITSRLGRFR